MKEEYLNIEKRLERLKNGKVFRVPDNYFEDFSRRLKARIAEEEKPAASKGWFNYYIRPALGIAAVLAIMALSIYIPVKLTTPDLLSQTALNTGEDTDENSNESNDQVATYEELTLLPSSQFLSALEAVDSEEDVYTVDLEELEDYIADNSFEYELYEN